MPENETADLTVDELARGAGIPVSTVRLYQNRGILPPPEKRGRVGYYGPGHVQRLRLIAELQERGFSLAGIKEALDAWGSGRSLGELLGAGDADREPVRLSPAELADRFDGVVVSQADLQRASRLGLIELDGADIVVSHRSFAEIGPAVARLGLPIGEILDEYEALQAAMAEVATRFRAVFDRHLWQPFVDAGQPADRVATLPADAATLATLAQSVVATELSDRFDAFVAGYVERAGLAE